MPRITIRETRASGETLNTYIASPTSGLNIQGQGQGHDPGTSINKPSPTGRVDIFPHTSHVSDQPTSFSSAWTLKLLEPFLPIGYPDSVSPDYTSYQIYDSLQALFSTTASLLASRAVLTTLGVGSSGASTTFAMYLSIVQSTLSNLTSILFAHRFSTAISQHVKFFRFFADIVNDIAFLLDVLSPSLPQWGRVPALCAASCCRALCGVTGGASKAVLSGHFAKGGNVGELAAKDGSQEVLVNLVGMWLGGAAVGKVEGIAVTWSVLVLMLAGHLWCNWMAVASIRLRSLVGERATILVAELMDNNGKGGTVEEVGQKESILFGWWSGASNLEMRSRTKVIGTCQFGTIRELLACTGWDSQAGGRAYIGDMSLLQALIEIFEHEDYLLWWEHRTHRCIVVLKSGGDAACQLKAMCHAWRIAAKVDRRGESATAAATMDMVSVSLATNRAEWGHLLEVVRTGGWDVEATSLVADSGTRVEAQLQQS